jgi:hypothetical protein
MARTINSPGVQITETDLSLTTQIGGGTNVFVPGFAPQGPTDEVILITSISEFETTYGSPETPAERYFYYSCKEVLNSPATLLTTRLPYGSGSGAGFATQYSALLYPTASSVNGFTIGAPTHISLNETQYNNILQNNISWSSLTVGTAVSGTGALSGTVVSYVPTTAELNGTALNAGIVVLNSSQTTVNEAFEGYYVSVTDNSEFGPDTDFTAVNAIYSLTGTDSFYSIPSTRIGFALSGSKIDAGTNSVSEIIEALPNYDFGNSFYSDSVIVNIFKVRNSTYDPQSLVYALAESHIGSLDAHKKTVGEIGGTPKSFYIGDTVNNNSSNIKVLVNPYISQKTQWQSLSSINPSKTVRNNTSSKALFAGGVFAPSYTYEADKKVGDITTKIDRALTHIETSESAIVDVVLDAGLSTIFANTSGGGYYDDTAYTNVTTLSTENDPVIQRWGTIYNQFNNFVQNTRKDCVFIADPLRQIFVNGEDVKTLSIRGNTFSTNIYTPLKKLLTGAGANSNYSAIYGNWVKAYDAFSDKFTWLPASGYVGAIFARTDTNAQPWYAPAGLNRGVISNITDIAFNPNQKQRDFLYTISINPIVNFSGDGYVVFGQKTLQSKPSAFDRINVRRLFVTLERAVQNAVKYFVFEPNTEFTRTRLKNTITPVFELAKNTEGLYDYLIVCDERNNNPDVVDRNELAVDIYIKPVRAAEFILVNFIATRTGQNFQELI